MARQQHICIPHFGRCYQLAPSKPVVVGGFFPRAPLILLSQRPLHIAILNSLWGKLYYIILHECERRSPNSNILDPSFSQSLMLGLKFVPSWYSRFTTSVAWGRATLKLRPKESSLRASGPGLCPILGGPPLYTRAAKNGPQWGPLPFW